MIRTLLIVLALLVPSMALARTDATAPFPKNKYWKHPLVHLIHEDEWLASDPQIRKAAIDENYVTWREELDECIHRIEIVVPREKQIVARQKYCPRIRSEMRPPILELELSSADLTLYTRYVRQAIRSGVHLDDVEQYARQKMGK